jgi:MOSC domain-containing protein YiiM
LLYNVIAVPGREVFESIWFMAEIVAVCRSDHKGTSKKPVESVSLREDHGVVGDAHAECCTHRQVSLLAEESVDKIAKTGPKVGAADVAGNFTTRGIILTSLPVAMQLSLGSDVVLQVTQIGKECHVGCDIFRQIGRRIMPKEGIFARVLRGGIVRPGDTIEIGQQPEGSNA